MLVLERIELVLACHDDAEGTQAVHDFNRSRVCSQDIRQTAIGLPGLLDTAAQKRDALRGDPGLPLVMADGALLGA